MKWSKEQIKAHEENAEKFRKAYVKGENKTMSIEDIVNDRRRCVALINTVLPLRLGMEVQNIKNNYLDYIIMKFLILLLIVIDI